MSRPDYFDNMRRYYKLPLQQKLQNHGKYVIIEKLEITGVSNTPDELKDSLNRLGRENKVSSNSYLVRVGFEGESLAPPSSSILVIEDLRNSTAAADYDPISYEEKSKIVWRYDPKECQVIEASAFTPFRGYTDDGRLIASTLVQTDEMKNSTPEMGVPVTFLVATGQPNIAMHEHVFKALKIPYTQSEGHQLFVNGHSLLVSPIYPDKRFKGINVLGWDAIKQMGLRVEATPGNTAKTTLDFTQSLKPVVTGTKMMYNYVLLCRFSLATYI